MAASEENSRIVVPFKPSLSYMCLAKIAVGLYNEFGFKILKMAFPKMIFFNLPEFKECSPENFTLLCNRAKERLLLIPTSLRERIKKAVEGLQYEIGEWIQGHEKKIVSVYYYYGKCTFFWRSDGSIDRTKTAQEIVRNQNVAIRARFDIACMYCLEKSVQTLWAALEANGETDCYDIPYDECFFNAMVPFWLRWMREGAQSDWTEAAREYLDFRMFHLYRYGSEPSFSTLFRVLMPEVRCKFFDDLVLCDTDDLRFCLYTLTNKEQEDVMRKYARYVLVIHSEGPLASLFLETAEKSWKFLDHPSFHRVLRYLLDLKDNTDYDYYAYLAVEFWNRSPDHFKEHRGIPSFCVCEKILEFIEEWKEEKS
ncbi:hypothetical protein AVEN_159492-1 [Araneus ventricosus]|uniref:Uncharacterized protein n=1 Tax=Araneus ventricosus TaxID=182803 RepID=A0A4Y2A167_ARAVE|nr:hypothetical protein AVEN_159492-1 [Araneus ventricosus]